MTASIDPIPDRKRASMFQSTTPSSRSHGSKPPQMQRSPQPPDTSSEPLSPQSPRETPHLNLHLKPLYIAIAVLSSAFLAFGLYHVHSFANITEGGVLGLTLLLDHWFGFSPAISSFILNVVCYAVGWKVLGRDFLAYSIIATAAFSLAYAIFEQLPPLWPQLVEHPLAASIIGAVFVGIGAGLTVRVGGASSGDDALAMTLSHLTRIEIQWVYLLTDLTVLGLSLTYIPLERIVFSLITVVVSGQIIGLIQKMPMPSDEKPAPIKQP